MLKRPFAALALLSFCLAFFSSAAEPPKAPEPIPPPADVAAPPVDAATTASGLASKVLAPGTGTERPQAGDLVRVHYAAWTTDGKLFDSSATKGNALVVRLERLIPGCQEGLKLMVEGERRRLWIPAELAYAGQADRPQSMVVFDVQLLDVLRLPPVPTDLEAPPADAGRSKSGLTWKVLKPGTGSVHPGPKSLVEVQFTGWDIQSGWMIESSILRDTLSTFSLQKIYRGLAEGMKLMTEGEVRRFWIPGKLMSRPRSPGPRQLTLTEHGAVQTPSRLGSGDKRLTVVYEVELVRIIKP